MEFDLDAETKKLRNRSALTMPVLVLFVSTVVIGAPIIWLGFLPEFQALSISWIPLTIGGVILVVGGFFFCFYARKIRQLITTGEVAADTLTPAAPDKFRAFEVVETVLLSMLTLLIVSWSAAKSFNPVRLLEPLVTSASPAVAVPAIISGFASAKFSFIVFTKPSAIAFLTSGCDMVRRLSQ